MYRKEMLVIQDVFLPQYVTDYENLLSTKYKEKLNVSHEVVFGEVVVTATMSEKIVTAKIDIIPTHQLKEIDIKLQDKKTNNKFTDYYTDIQNEDMLTVMTKLFDIACQFFDSEYHINTKGMIFRRRSIVFNDASLGCISNIV